MDKWQVEKPAGRCSGTGRTIDAGEEYFGALVETGEGFMRKDYCVQYWQAEKPEVFCYWKTRMPTDDKKPVFIDDGMLMAFFDRLEGDAEPERVNFRFVLALILMRKRRLKYDSERNDGGRDFWCLKVAGEGRTAEVLNPHLDEEKVEQLSGQLGQIMQVEL
jgi:hypothetical protein